MGIAAPINNLAMREPLAPHTTMLVMALVKKRQDWLNIDRDLPFLSPPWYLGYFKLVIVDISAPSTIESHKYLWKLTPPH